MYYVRHRVCMGILGFAVREFCISIDIFLFIFELQTLKELDSDLDKIAITNPSEVVDYLKKSGLFHADILTLEKRRGYSPDKEDYHKLRRFVHTTRRQDKTCNSLYQLIMTFDEKGNI